MDTEEDARYEAWLDQLREDFKNDPDFVDEIRGDPAFLDELRTEFSSDFQLGRLQSYFLMNSADLLQPAQGALARAKKLREEDATASFVFAVAAIELIIRGVLLKPMIHGLVDEKASPVFVKLMLKQLRAKDAYNFLGDILQQFANFDFANYPAPVGGETPLVQALEPLFNKRHNVVHQGADAVAQDADFALIIATDLMDTVIPRVLSGIYLTLRSDNSITHIRFLA